MSTAREDVAQFLRHNTQLTVVDAVTGVENARHAVVLVTRSSITPGPVPKQRDDGLTVWVLSPLVDPIAAEADLDRHVDIVTNALDSHPFLRWESGERDVYAEAFHAFRVTTTHRTLIEE